MTKMGLVNCSLPPLEPEMRPAWNTPDAELTGKIGPGEVTKAVPWSSLTPEQKHGLYDPVAMAAAADALPIEQVAQRWIVATSPEEVTEQVRPYVEAGFTHLVLHGPGHDQKRFLDQVSRDVLPAHDPARDPDREVVERG